MVLGAERARTRSDLARPGIARFQVDGSDQLLHRPPGSVLLAASRETVLKDHLPNLVLRWAHCAFLFDRLFEQLAASARVMQ